MPRRRKKKLDFGDIIGQSILNRVNPTEGTNWREVYRRVYERSMATPPVYAPATGMLVNSGTATTSYTTATTGTYYAPITYVDAYYNSSGTFTYTWR